MIKRINHYIRKCVLIIVCVIFICTANFHVFSLSDAGDVKTVNNYHLWNNLCLEYSPECNDIDYAIVGFDVSKNGELAIALRNHSIVVFDKNNEPKGTLKFSVEGSFFVFWNESNLCIYLVRGGDIVEVTTTGRLVSTNEFSNSVDADEFCRMLKKKNNLTYDNYTYVASNNNIMLKLFMPSHEYTVLERYDKRSNSKTVVLDSSKRNLMIVVLITLFITIISLSFYVLMTILIIRTAKQSRNDDIGRNDNW